MGKHRPRSDAATPLSAHWRLYRPQDLASELGVDGSAAVQALEKTGFSKAVRIREELIRWKTRLLVEQRQVTREIQELDHKRFHLSARGHEIANTLAGIRDVLRIPREDSNGQAGS